MITDAVELGINGLRVPFAEGVVSVGDLELEVRSSDVDGGRRLDLTVRNPSRHPVALDDVVIRMATRPALLLEHGYQSWSVVRRCRPDDVRPERAEIPDWAKACYFSRPDAAGKVVAGDHVLLTGDGVVGFLGARRHLGTVEAVDDGLLVRALFDHVPLGAGDERAVEPVWAAPGPPGIRYSDFASLWGLEAGARISTPAPIGWSSGHEYGPDVTPDDVRTNLKLAADRGLELIQIDAGYQSAVGDWLVPAASWPAGTSPLVAEIQHAGLRAGLWTAPFVAAENSEVLRAHPEWAATDALGQPVRATYEPKWGGWAVALDTTRDDVLDHLRATFAALADQGFDYHKVDFCYAAAMPARRHDPTQTRAEALRAGLKAVRDGIGDDAFLLGSGCPLGPAVGTVDGLRVSPEVAPAWTPGPAPAERGWPGLAETAPAAINAIAAAVLRAPLHRRVFVNDPDCLLLRPSGTDLGAGQRAFLAAVITGTGAFTIVSDDLGRYTEAEWGLLEALRSVHNDVDTLLDIDDPFADPIVVRSAAGTQLTIDWRADAPGGPLAQLGMAD